MSIEVCSSAPIVVLHTLCYIYKLRLRQLEKGSTDSPVMTRRGKEAVPFSKKRRRTKGSFLRRTTSILGRKTLLISMDPEGFRRYCGEIFVLENSQNGNWAGLNFSKTQLFVQHKIFFCCTQILKPILGKTLYVRRRE